MFIDRRAFVYLYERNGTNNIFNSLSEKDLILETYMFLIIF